MNIFRGQIWKTKKMGREVFICGVQEGFVWYMDIRYEHDWIYAKEEKFKEHFEFAGLAIAPKAYWKAKATGQPVQITSVRDDGCRIIHVYFDLLKLELPRFYKYYQKCPRVETLYYMAKEKTINKNIEKMKNRIRHTPNRRL